MNVVRKATQKVGEGVGLYDKTEETEDFKRQEKYFTANSDATNVLVKELTPDSASGAVSFVKDKMGKDSIGKTSEQKQGELFMKLGNELRSSATHDSPYGTALISLGESCVKIGDVHQQHDITIIDSSVGPLRIFNENTIKDIHRLGKNYHDKRLDYDSAVRSHKKKPDSKTQLSLDTKTKIYEEARRAYLEKISTLPSAEADQVGQMSEYCRAMAEYHTSITSMWEEAAANLVRIKQEAPTSYPTTSSTSYSSPGVVVSSTTTYISNAPPSGGYGSESLSPRGAPPVPGAARPAPPPPGRPVSLPQCRALYDFDAANASELSVRKGDVIIVKKQVNQDWIEGELGGRVGLIPQNYIEMLQ